MRRGTDRDSLASRRPSRAPPGAAPGALVPHPDAWPSRIVVRRFGPGSFDEAVVGGGDELAALRDGSGCLWVEVTGLADVSAIASLGRVFGLHALALEDVLDPTQRPKAEHYEDHTFVVLKTLTLDDRVRVDQLSVFFGGDFVLTLQDEDRGALAPVRERLRQGRGKIRARGADYLAYTVLDAVVDCYYPVVEDLDDHLERVEDAVLDAKGIDPIDLTQTIRQDLRAILRAVWPARDALSSLLREEAPHLRDETHVYLRDCYDHLVQLQEMVESSREIAATLLDAYISRVSLRTNEVMKVLTVVATLFIPLTFITSLYGMNFNRARSPLNMPELDWYWGYPFALLLMAAVTAGSLLYFRRKGWFGGGQRGP